MTSSNVCQVRNLIPPSHHWQHRLSPRQDCGTLNLTTNTHSPFWDYSLSLRHITTSSLSLTTPSFQLHSLRHPAPLILIYFLVPFCNPYLTLFDALERVNWTTNPFRLGFRIRQYRCQVGPIDQHIESSLRPCPSIPPHLSRCHSLSSSLHSTSTSGRHHADRRVHSIWFLSPNLHFVAISTTLRS